MRIGILILFILAQLGAGTADPNCWRGLRPLHSNCDDVKRILKVDQCVFPLSEYTLPDFRVLIEFENESCDSESRAWRVPEGTVTAITLTPRRGMRPTELGLDISKYDRQKDDEIVGLEHYRSRKDGVTVDLYNGYIQNLFLYPQEKDENMRCTSLKP